MEPVVPPQSAAPPAGSGGVPARLPTYRELLAFAVPMMIGLMTTALIAFVDTLFIGRLGTAALAAVPLAAMTYLIGWIVLVGVMRNAIAFVARAFGAGQEAEIGRILAHYHVLALVGLPLLGLYVQAWPLFAAAGDLNPEVARLGWVYLGTRVWDVPFSMLLVLYTSFYQSLGNSRFPMLVHLGVLVANVVLDYGLIFGHGGLPALGVQGSALASVAAQALGTVAIVAAAHGGALRRRFALHVRVRLSPALLRDILRIGVPSGVADGIEVAAWVGFSMIVGRLGESSLAASNIGIQVSHLLFLPAYALGIAAASYMGRFLGAGRPDLAGRTTWRALGIGVGYMAVLGAPLWFYGAAIASWFTADAAVIRQAALMFKVMALYQAFDGLGFVTRTALGGAGDTRVPAFWLTAIVLGVLFPGSWGLSQVVQPPLIGAWLGAFAYMVLLAGAMVWRLHGGAWRHMRLDGTHREPGSAPAPNAA